MKRSLTATVPCFRAGETKASPSAETSWSTSFEMSEAETEARPEAFFAPRDTVKSVLLGTAVPCCRAGDTKAGCWLAFPSAETLVSALVSCRTSEAETETHLEVLSASWAERSTVLAVAVPY